MNIFEAGRSPGGGRPAITEENIYTLPVSMRLASVPPTMEETYVKGLQEVRPTDQCTSNAVCKLDEKGLFRIQLPEGTDLQGFIGALGESLRNFALIDGSNGVLLDHWIDPNGTLGTLPTYESFGVTMVPMKDTWSGPPKPIPFSLLQTLIDAAVTGQPKDELLPEKMNGINWKGVKQDIGDSPIFDEARDPNQKSEWVNEYYAAALEALFSGRATIDPKTRIATVYKPNGQALSIPFELIRKPEAFIESLGDGWSQWSQLPLEIQVRDVFLALPVPPLILLALVLGKYFVWPKILDITEALAQGKVVQDKVVKPDPPPQAVQGSQAKYPKDAQGPKSDLPRRAQAALPRNKTPGEPMSTIRSQEQVAPFDGKVEDYKAWLNQLWGEGWQNLQNPQLDALVGEVTSPDRLNGTEMNIAKAIKNGSVGPGNYGEEYSENQVEDFLITHPRHPATKQFLDAEKKQKILKGRQRAAALGGEIDE